MKEIFSMWKHTRMIVLTAMTAAIYGAALIAFKPFIVIIPGITEVRPANSFPVVFGLLFGPAGAWGSAIGNAIGDLMGGTISWASVFGFLGNFFLGFIPYKLWGSLGLISQKDISTTVNSMRKFLAYMIVSIVAAIVCSSIIAWYLDWVKIVPFKVLALSITINNAFFEILLGPPLLLLIYPRVKRWGLLWTDVMEREDVSRGFARRIGAVLMVVAALGGIVAGMVVASESWAAVTPFLVLLLIASFMLSGREQFVAEAEENETDEALQESGVFNAG